MKNLVITSILATSITLPVLAAPAADQQEFLDSFAHTAPESQSIWPDFIMKDIPTLVVQRSPTGELLEALALNHPNPAALGEVEDLGNLAHGSSAQKITNLKHQGTLGEIENYDFTVPLGGVSTFVIIAEKGGDDPYMQINNPDFLAYLLHEGFHRHQIDKFNEQMPDVFTDTYDYSAENLYLARLEDLLLIEADETKDKAMLQTLAAELVALRQHRLQRDYRVALDEAQEQIEGSARYIEARLVGHHGSGYNNHNLELDLEDEPYSFGVKDYFGFGRFYSSGSMVIDLADRLGAKGHLEEISNGKSPMVALASHLAKHGATAKVEDAIKRADPDGRLRTQANKWAETAKSEPDPFADY